MSDDRLNEDGVEAAMEAAGRAWEELEGDEYGNLPSFDRREVYEAAIRAYLDRSSSNEPDGRAWRWASSDEWRFLARGLSDAAVADFVRDQEKIAPVVVAKVYLDRPAAIRSALEPSPAMPVAEGLATVPREPTEAMIEAGLVARTVAVGGIYRAMIAAAPASPSPAPVEAKVREAGKHGIYIASKVRHAARWQALRDSGVPIISTWIDEAGEGESQDLGDLWDRCLTESANAAAIVVYREPDEALKGAWAELGAAASHGVPVFAVGIREFTISNHRRINHFDTLDEALAAALAALSPAQPGAQNNGVVGEAKEELIRLAHQTKTDLLAAHTEICKLQGLDPATNSWPEWSSPAHTIAWCDDIFARASDPIPDGWVPCSPAWLEAGGDCANAPRAWSEKRGNHYHPPVALSPQKESGN